MTLVQEAITKLQATTKRKEKEAILKRLNDLGAYGLVKYYSDIKIM